MDFNTLHMSHVVLFLKTLKYPSYYLIVGKHFPNNENLPVEGKYPNNENLPVKGK